MIHKIQFTFYVCMYKLIIKALILCVHFMYDRYCIIRYMYFHYRIIIITWMISKYPYLSQGWIVVNYSTNHAIKMLFRSSMVHQNNLVLDSEEEISGGCSSTHNWNEGWEGEKMGVKLINCHQHAIHRIILGKGFFLL